MIELTKINGELILINPNQIECIEFIPESKIVMMNGRYHLLKESGKAIRTKIIEFQHQCTTGLMV